MRISLDLTPEVFEALACRVAELLRAELATPQAVASEYLTIAETAALLRAKPQRVYDLLSARRLTRFKDGSRVLVLRAEVEAYVQGVALTAARPHGYSGGA